MKLGYTLAAVVLAAGLASAQTIEHRSKTKVKVEDGEQVTLTGCVGQSADGSYVLTNAAGKKGALGTYVLAATDDNELNDIEKHVGHRVEITGKAVDQGKGKLKVETKTEGTTGKTESKSEVKGDLKGLPYLGVKSLKMVASVCP